jgi:hypothetical protein
LVDPWRAGYNHDALLPSPLEQPVANLLFEDLAHGVAFKGEDVLDLFGTLELGEALGLAVGRDAGDVERGVAARGDDGAKTLTGAGIWEADYGDVGDVGMAEQDVFDLKSRNIFCVADDDIFETAGDEHVVVANFAEIPGAEPAILIKGGGVECRVDVAVEALWALEANLVVDEPEMYSW